MENAEENQTSQLTKKAALAPSQKSPVKKYKIAIGILAVALVTVSGVLVYQNFVPNTEESQVESATTTDESEPEESGLEGSTNEEEKSNEEASSEKASSDSVAYIYLPSVGYRIKIPEDLSNVSYQYDAVSEMANAELWITAAKKSGHQYAPDFLYSGTNYNSDDVYVDDLHLVCLLVVSKDLIKYNEEHDKERWYSYRGETVYDDGTYEFQFSSEQAMHSTDEEENKWESESLGAIMDMLSDPDNYEKY